MVKLEMTIDEALAFADEWSRGLTLYPSAQGWRVVCMLLADEVRRQRTQLEDSAEAGAALESKLHALAPRGTCGCSYDRPADVCMHHSPEVMRLRAELERVQELSLRECGIGFVDVRVLTPNAKLTRGAQTPDECADGETSRRAFG